MKVARAKEWMASRPKRRNHPAKSVPMMIVIPTTSALLPGEKREIMGAFADEDLQGERPVLKVRGWNIKIQ